MSHTYGRKQRARRWRLLCQWVMPHIYESCHLWLSRVIFQWVMSHINESCHMSMSPVTYQWGLWLKGHIRLMDLRSWDTMNVHPWVMSQIVDPWVTHPPDRRFMSHDSYIYGLDVDESWIYDLDMTHGYTSMSHDSWIYDLEIRWI